MPYKDLETRRIKAREYAAAYRARVIADKVIEPKFCLVCEADISHKMKTAKFCCRKHKTLFFDSQRNYAQEYAKNRETRQKQALRYYHADVEASRKKLLARQKQNLALFAANQAKRRSAKLQRTPKWLSDEDFWLVNEIYTLSALRTKLTGAVWHVDHVYPLQGKKVSGLHVPTNLRVILGRDNVAKHNRFEAA
jgi:hypothetical protein